MRSSSRIVLACVMVLTVTAMMWADEKARDEKPAPAPARPEGEKPRPAAPNVGGWGMLVKETQLGEEQVAKLVALVTANRDATEAWKKENLERFIQLEREQAAAREAKDEAKIKALGEQLSAMRAKRDEPRMGEKAQVLALLTPEQKGRWDAYNLGNTLLMGLRKAELAGEQKDQVRDIARGMAEELTAINKTQMKEDEAARRAVYEKAMKQAKERVLTPAQVEALMKETPKKEPKQQGKENTEPTKAEPRKEEPRKEAPRKEEAQREPMGNREPAKGNGGR